MEFLDARRLTGPGLVWNQAGSILEVRCTPAEARKLIPAWERNLQRMLDAVGWSEESSCHWSLSGGISLVFSAPIDALYAATAINEWAWACCDAELNGADMPDFEASVASIRAAIEEESNPDLLALQQAAHDHDLAFLWDDEQVSIGHGKGSQTWPCRQLPLPSDLDWRRFANVPIALVTGTNGKTTTVRLAMHILRDSGRHVGMSSTEWISVNDRIIDRGDWSGPGGARSVLREPDVDIAILETARGGLVRRGLAVDKADVALITNVSEDHLGDFGTQNIDELLNVKWIVTRAVEASGTLILNADDPLLVSKSAEFAGKIVWFSLSAQNAVVDLHLQTGGTAFVVDNNELLRLEGDSAELICRTRDIPITLGGTAKHNVANALAAAALTDLLGAGISDIRQGLTTMTQHDNPGRSNVYSIDGFKVLVDFAHNPHAMQALFDMASAMPAKRRLLAFGQAGDRTDALIRELVRRAWAIGLDVVHISDLDQYARGREPGVVPAMIHDELVKCGARDYQIRHFEQESDSFDAALDWAREGDLLILLALGGNQSIIDKLLALVD